MYRGITACVAVIGVLASCSSTQDNHKATHPSEKTGTIPQAAQQIMDKPAYSAARWIYYIEDPKKDLVLLSNQPNQMVFTGSTAKQFTVATVYDTLGPDTRLTTPVYATAPIVGDVIDGDVVLVASGDLALGGRRAMQGRVDHAFDAHGIGHIYPDLGPKVRKPPGDPLAGLDDLARQIAAKGVRAVDGDVVIDTRLWEPSHGHEGPAPAIYVNDNILDIEVTPGEVGEPATVAITPDTAAFTVEAQVNTVAGNEHDNLQVSVDPADASKLVVRGVVAVGEPKLTVYRIPDAGKWARTLFIEALERAGISVAAPTVGLNDQSRLPAAGNYPKEREIASLESPPLKAFGTMILQTSYNTGANAMLCLLAMHANSTNCEDGLATIRATIEKAGLVSDEVVLTDGEGAYPASSTPKQVAGWVKWAAAQPWGPEFVAGQPVLGESGSLAALGRDTAAKGKVMAKTGTVAAVDPTTGRALFNVKSLSGFVTTDDGRRLVFNLSMSGATYPDVPTGIQQSSADLAEVAAAFQQHLSGK